jgi:hypothetical protein
MLYDDPVLYFKGLTIFKDFSDSRTYYFLPPEAPRIARSAEDGETGDYALRLVLYRPDPNAPPPTGMEEGGGFLNLDTDLRVSEGLLDQARDEIRRKFGADANLVPVPFTDGSVELVLLGVSRDDQGQPFVRKMAGSTVPALYGTQRAAFSTVLDRHGAALMKAVLEEGGVTMAVAIYHLTYAGIGPAYNLKITVDYQRVFDHLDLRLKAGVSAGNKTSSFVAKAGFHMLMQELKESRAIKVEEVDPIPGENGRTPTNQEMINEIIGNLMGAKWFKPTLTNVGSMTDLSAAATSASSTGSSTSGGSNGTTGTTTPPTGTGTTPPATGTPPAEAPAGDGAPKPATGGAAAGAGGEPSAPLRQAATWTRDAFENATADHGVQEPFEPSTTGTQETLVIRGAGAVARTGATPQTLQPTALQGGKLLVDVPPGETRHVEISWPAQAEQEDTFHLFFAFDQPENSAEVTAYSTGTPPSPGDARFLNASQAKSASSAGGLASLEAWLKSRQGNTLKLRAYASYEADENDRKHNQDLSERRMEVAARTIERLVSNRFNSSDRVALGHVPAATSPAPTVPTITPGGGAPDGHGPSSRPEHRVAVIHGLTQVARPQSVLRGHLTRPQSVTPPKKETEIPPGQETGKTGNGGGSKTDANPTKVEASFEVNLEMIKQEERVVAVYELNTRKARTHPIHPQGQLVLDVIDPAKYIIEADGALAFFQRLDLTASTTAQWQLDGIHSIQVQLRYGPTADGGFQRTGELNLTPDKATDVFKSGVLRDESLPGQPVVHWYEYKVIVNYTQDVALGNQQGAVSSVGVAQANPEGWIRSDARNLVIHPRDITPAMTVNVASGIMHYDLLERLQLVLTYGPYKQNIALSAAKPEHRLVIRPEAGLAGAPLRTEGTLFYKDGAQVPLPSHEWKPQELVVINEPRDNILQVRVILADPGDEYERVEVRLQYEQGSRVVEERFALKDHAEIKEWAVRLEDPAQRAWRYEATLIKKSGDIDSIAWKDGVGQQLILGVQAVDVVPVQVTWLMPLPAADLVAVKIDLLYEDQDNGVRWSRSELIRQGHSGTFAWPIAIKDERKRAYRYRVTEFRPGGPKEREWQDSDSEQLVLL